MIDTELQAITSNLLILFNEEKPQFSEGLLAGLSPDMKEQLCHWIVGELGKEDLSLRMQFQDMVGYLHKRLLKEKLDFAEGYEVFFESERMWPGLKELQYSVSQRLRNILQLMYSHLPDYYCEFSNKQLNPIWFTPLFEDIDGNMTVCVDKVFHCLVPMVQGICAAMAWRISLNDHSDELSDAGLERLDRISNLLTMEQRWIYYAKILEELLRDTFPSVTGRRDLAKQGSLFQSMLGWTAHALGGVQWSSEEIRTAFLHNLTGRVNRESWLGALYLTDRITELGEGFAKENARLLREEVLREYPHYWTKEEKKGYYFSGAQSIALLEELANTMYALKGNSAMADLNKVKEVYQASGLWRLRNTHRYAEYLGERQLSLAHSLLSVLLAQLIWDKEGRLPSEWSEFEQHFFISCKHLIDDHLLESEKLILAELLSRFGDLYWKYSGTIDILVKLMPTLASPLYSVYLIRSLDQVARGNDLLILLERQIAKYLGDLRSSERLELARSLYVIKEFRLCLEVCEHIRYGTGASQWELELYSKLYASAALSTLSSQNQTADVDYLWRSKESLDQYKQKYPYLHNEEILVLRGYVVGALFDREVMDVVTLRNEYQSLVGRVASRGGKLLGFIKAILLVRILTDNPVDKQRYLCELRILIEHIDGQVGIEGGRLLLQTWLAETDGLDDEQRHFMEQAIEYRTQLEAELPLLPMPLRNYLLRDDGDANADSPN